MQTLLLEPGDLVQIKSTDLPPGQFIKLQAQSTSFLDISDPKAVLENAFRNFSCLSKGDVFTFTYNDQIYEMAVLETKPATDKNAIGVLETDLEVDFAPPVGYEEPKRPDRTGTPRSETGSLLRGGILHNRGTMAQAINYDSIAPGSRAAAAGAQASSSNFLLGGQKLNAKRGTKNSSSNTSEPPPSITPNKPPTTVRRTNGPQPLRLPPNKLFFGYEIKPVKKSDETNPGENSQPKFQGQGQTLRGGNKRKGARDGKDSKDVGEQEEQEEQVGKGKGKDKGSQRLGGGRTLREAR